MLKREIHTTKDGSKTIFIPEWNEHYHSKHGALQEAEHVFIKNGLALIKNDNIKILEFGFGTGLNALISSIESSKQIEYHSLEKYPMNFAEIEELQYPEIFKRHYDSPKDYYNKILEKIHSTTWGELHKITPNFSLKKINTDFKEAVLPNDFYNLVYFDAFGKRVQPELWSISIFEKIFSSLKKDGLLTTYACNGETKRALKQVGFTVKKKPGPPGKREMLNAWKN